MCFERHAEDVRSLGPGGVYTPKRLDTLRFGECMAAFEEANQDVAAYVRLSALVERCCEKAGVPFNELPVPNKEAIALRAKQKKAYLARVAKEKAAKKAAGEAADEEAAPEAAALGPPADL